MQKNLERKNIKIFALIGCMTYIVNLYKVLVYHCMMPKFLNVMSITSSARVEFGILWVSLSMFKKIY